jgi:hypothetical protein
MRRMLEDWTAHPVQRRAGQAVRIAWTANRWIRTHPDDPLSSEIRRRLPTALKQDAENAAAEDRPLLAMEFYVAYVQLNPEDASALQKIQELRARSRPAGQGRDR